MNRNPTLFYSKLKKVTHTHAVQGREGFFFYVGWIFRKVIPAGKPLLWMSVTNTRFHTFLLFYHDSHDMYLAAIRCQSH